MIWPELIIILLIIFLFYYKRDWNPQKPPFFSDGELVKIGHRGAPLQSHENTINSFIKAVESRVVGVELDVQYSADKKLIVYHDWTLDALLGAEKRIEKTLYSDIEKVQFDNENTNKIPLFTEVLDVLPKNFIKVIEIKSKHLFDSGIEKNILVILKNNDLENSCIISSFNPFVIRRVRKLNPNIQTAYLWTKNGPLFTINSPLWVWWCKPDGFHADIDFLDQNLIKWIRRKKMSALAFTIFDQKQLKRAQDLGLDGIIIEDLNLN